MMTSSSFGDRRRAIAAAAVCIVTLGAASHAWSGEIRGVVRLPAATTASGPSRNPYPGQIAALAGANHSAGTSTAADAVVYLIPQTPGLMRSAPPKGPRPELRQRGQAFVPRVLPIRVGTAVSFPNEDPFYHNVFSYSSAKRFDLGRYGSGKSREITFDKPGLVKVFCEIHSDMAAYILVLDADRFVCAAADGRYAISGVPAGDYVVKVWHPDHPERSAEVTVPAQAAVDLDISM